MNCESSARLGYLHLVYAGNICARKTHPTSSLGTGAKHDRRLKGGGTRTRKKMHKPITAEEQQRDMSWSRLELRNARRISSFSKFTLCFPQINGHYG